MWALARSSAGMHVKIVDDLRVAAGEDAQHLLQQGVDPAEVGALEKKAATCVSSCLLQTL